ncbi:hypothetical protein GALL_343440 [mine drainage metagenome]|uniref:Uncharacterized protein n=1 Tax=mine drainage metagenome TaxID=410659 RepID=A0A1J5R286_9ZZZZ
MSDEKEFSLEQIRAAARALVIAGQDVRKKLDALTVRALAQRDLAEQQVREVLTAITEGISLGAAERADEMRASLTDALHGMDDALQHAAEAMNLALGEANSSVREFAQQDVKQGLNELKNLEALFLETVGHVAQGANELVRQEMNRLVEHARRTGTGTGDRVRTVAEDLGHRVRTTAAEAGDAGRRAALEIGSRVASLASRKLSEIADRIARRAEQLKQK